jgi:NhaP-type Na+/H+ or K+/H+ antiporter
MSAGTRKMIMWTLGMALVGALIGSKDTLSATWYGPFVQIASYIFGGAVIGLVLGYLSSLRLRKSK